MDTVGCKKLYIYIYIYNYIFTHADSVYDIVRQ